MPKGIEVVVDGGFATIDFVDRSLRGSGLNRLLQATPPEMVETLSRSGPRRQYRVPEGNAREAGLLDVPAVDALASGDTGFAEALASASPAGARPTPTTAKDRAYVGTTPAQEASDVTHVATTLVPGSGMSTAAVPPVHTDVIEHVKPKPAKKAPAKKAAPAPQTPTI